MPDAIRLGFVCSSAGGLLDAVADAAGARRWPIEIAGVVTDRPCGAEDVAAGRGLPGHRIVEGDDERWSETAARTLADWEAQVVVLLYLRRVGSALWRDRVGPVWNLHPSVLPAHRGLGALRRSHEEATAHGTPLGVTLHHATETPDTGPVIAQGRFALADAPTLDHAAHLSFLLKLMLLAEAALVATRGAPESVPQTDVDRLLGDGVFRGLVPRDDVVTAAAAFTQPWAEGWRRRLTEVPA